MLREITASMPPHIRREAEQILAEESSERRIFERICALFPHSWPVAEILPSQIDLGLFDDYPPELCQKLRIIPISRVDIYLTCASFTPWDENRMRELRAANYDSVRTVCITKSAFEHLFEYVSVALGRQKTEEDYPAAPSELTAAPRPSGREMVKRMLYDAHCSGASDIHIEPGESRIVVKFRVNGELRVQEPIHRADQKVFLDALKDFALLPLNETKNLADCRFSHTVAPGKTLDFRVAKIPSSGKYENFVLRILDSEKLAHTPLPFEGHMLEEFLECLNAESGMIILTGPTGSGKTTTLYSAMSALDLAALNVRTIEDPIEYRLAKAVQTQIDPKNGVSFANTLRGMLRADPDVIMVGEIRDAETAELAAAASNTGHLVLTTLHTKSAAGVIGRLEDLGLTRGEIQEAASLVVSQRLFPKLCPNCKRQTAISDAQKEVFRRHNQDAHACLYERGGCTECGNTGIISRHPLFEFLRFTPEIRRMCSSGADTATISRENAKNFDPMPVSALKAIGEGILPFEVFYNFGK